MKILITGYTGFIGQFLTERLTNNGNMVVGLDLTPMPERQKTLCEGYTGDILSHDAMMAASRGVDTIVALAAAHHDFGVSRARFFEVNVKGTQILLDVAARRGIEKLVFYSSVAVYGDRNEPTTEDTLPVPSSDYGESKLEAEKLIESWAAEEKKRNVIIIRPTVVFGPRNYANMYNLIDQIYKKHFVLVGKGDNIKSVAYVENLVDANIFLMNQMKPGVQVFNYSDEPQMTGLEIVDTITRYMPHGIPRLKIPLDAAMSVGSVLDVLGKLTRRNFAITRVRMKKFAATTHHKAEKIRRLGFVQNVELLEGFRRMVEWYLDRANRS